MNSPYIVAVGGTLRPNSSTERAMRHVLGRRAARRRPRQAHQRTLAAIAAYQPDNSERSDAARDWWPNLHWPMESS